MRQTGVANHLVMFLILIFSFGWTGCRFTDSTLDNPRESEVPLSTPIADIPNNAISTPHSPTITSTSLPTSTPTKKTTPTPTKIIYATDVPQSTSTAVPSPISSTPFATPEITLICQQGERYTKCEDLILGLEFEYPNDFGSLTSGLREGGDSGYMYSYIFDSDPYYYINAGGRSRDFGESRGGMLTDLLGVFTEKEKGIAGICNWPRNQQAHICKEIKPHVVFLVSLTDDTDICDYDDWYGNLAAVAIDLPDNELINGFVFITSALSQENQQELAAIFGELEDETWPNCDENNRVAYNQQIGQIVQEIENSLGTEQPDPRVEPLIHLAESINFK